MPRRSWEKNYGLSLLSQRLLSANAHRTAFSANQCTMTFRKQKSPVNTMFAGLYIFLAETETADRHGFELEPRSIKCIIVQISSIHAGLLDFVIFTRSS